MIRPGGSDGWPADSAALAAVRAEIESRLNELAVRNALPATLRAGGKLMRPRLLLAVLEGHPCTRPARSVAAIATAVEFLHLATLHHDDVLDDSLLRRRAPSSTRRLGNKVSILFGDSLLTDALALLVRHAGRREYAAVADAASATLRGEIEQHLRHRTPELEERACLRVAARKTGSLFALAARLGAMIGGADRAGVAGAARLGSRLGTAWQLVDDALDYGGDQDALGKPPGTDYLQGVATLPLVRAWSVADPAARTAFAAGFGSGEPRLFAEARTIVVRTGVDATLAAAHRQIAGARALLPTLGPRPAASLEEYVDTIEHRIPRAPAGAILAAAR